MDEVFGNGNFVAQINYKSMSALSQSDLASVFDYILWYSRDKARMKFRGLYKPQDIYEDREYRFIDDEKQPYGLRKISEDEFRNLDREEYGQLFRRSVLTSSGFTQSCTFDFE